MAMHEQSRNKGDLPHFVVKIPEFLECLDGANGKGDICSCQPGKHWVHYLQTRFASISCFIDTQTFHTFLKSAIVKFGATNGCATRDPGNNVYQL